jgi:hypothetical protein
MFPALIQSKHGMQGMASYIRVPDRNENVSASADAEMKTSATNQMNRIGRDKNIFCIL